MTQELTDPFLLLLEMEKKARAFAHTLPLSQNIKREDTFIRFQCGEYGLAADIGDVTEITRVPPLTRIPGVYSWVRGLANIRGHLIAVIDLGDLLFKKKTRTDTRNRILVLDRQANCGVLVEQVEGLQNLESEDWCPMPVKMELNTEQNAEKFLISIVKQQCHHSVVNLRDLVTELHLFGSI